MSATLVEVEDDAAVDRLVEDIIASRPPRHFDGVMSLLKQYAEASVTCQRLAAQARDAGIPVLITDRYQDNVGLMVSLATTLRFWPGDDRTVPPVLQ